MDPLGLDVSTDASWIDLGASTPPPTAQPEFNSPVTQDSFSTLDSVSTGVNDVANTATSIFGSLTGLVTSVSAGSATANNASQAKQLAAQQASTTQKVQQAQSTAAINTAQINANIATAFNKLTASPVALVLLGAVVIYVVATKFAK